MHLLNMTSIYSVYHDPFGHPLASMCIPIKSTSQDSSSSLDALLCRVLWTLYGFSLKFISFSCNFYLQFVDPFVHFVPEVMLAKANARFVAQIFCTWRPEAKFQWKLVPAYQILAKELDDVIVHCQISFGQGAALNGRGIGHAFLSVRSYSKRRVIRRKRRARALQVAVSSWSNMLVGWLNISEIQCPCRSVSRSCPSGISLPPWLWQLGEFWEGWQVPGRFLHKGPSVDSQLTTEVPFKRRFLGEDDSR